MSILRQITDAGKPVYALKPPIVQKNIKGGYLRVNDEKISNTSDIVLPSSRYWHRSSTNMKGTLGQSPFALLDQSDYLQLLSQHLPPRDFRLEEWAYLRATLPLSPKAATAVIVDIAQKLQAYPRLLHGANCLILPRYQIHCSTTLSEVKHFVISNQETHHCDIYSLTTRGFAVSLSRQEIQQLLSETEEWSQNTGSSSDNDWLACVAQVLQEIHDDPQIERQVQSSARMHLDRLSKAGVLPPSMFVHFVDSEIPQFESLREFSTNSGFYDAHKITVDNVAFCFCVLRQWEDSDSDKVVYKRFCRELSVWHRVRHPNILPLIGATTEAFPGRYCFLVPWLSDGSLTSYLKTHPKFNKWLAVTQIVEGLNYLHGLDPPVGHKDLRGNNVLVRSDLVCVLTGFGLDFLLDDKRSTTLGCGSRYWTAPEVVFGEVTDQDPCPTDIYSLGSTIAEILIGEAPKFIWFSVIKGIEPTIPPPRSPEWGQEEQDLWTIAKACVEIAPEKRPDIFNIRGYFQENDYTCARKCCMLATEIARERDTLKSTVEALRNELDTTKREAAFVRKTITERKQALEMYLDEGRKAKERVHAHVDWRRDLQGRKVKFACL